MLVLPINGWWIAASDAPFIQLYKSICLPFATTKTTKTTTMMMMMSLYCRRCIWCARSTIALNSFSPNVFHYVRTHCTHHTIYTHWNTCIIYHIWIKSKTKWESKLNPQGDWSTCLPASQPAYLFIIYRHLYIALIFFFFSLFYFSIIRIQTPRHDQRTRVRHTISNFVLLSKWHNRINIEMLM